MKGECQSQADLYLPQAATLLRAEPMTALEMFFECRLDSGASLGHMPGQFVEISVPGFGEAPISIASAPSKGASFELVVRKVGNVSGALQRLKAGAKLGVRGPFGTHFPVDGALKGQDVVFICGGIGLVPVRAAIQYVLQQRADYGRVTILFGTRTPAERLFPDETSSWAKARDAAYLEIVNKGDEGWTGPVGVVTMLFSKFEMEASRTVVVIRGPPVMYKFAILELNKRAVPNERIYLSLERRMKCGVGKCGHCQINHLYACQDGPVFRYSDVAALGEAI